MTPFTPGVAICRPQFGSDLPPAAKNSGAYEIATPGTPCAHCGDVFKSSASRPSTEVFIVDSLMAAPVALHAHRPGEESTYVLCRAASELGTAFKQRVLRRAQRIRTHRYIGSLWYVMGMQASEPSGSVLLLQELLPLLETGARLTLASPCSQGQVVFDWLASLLGQRRSEIDVGVRFYPDRRSPDSSELRRAGPRSVAAAILGGAGQLQCA